MFDLDLIKKVYANRPQRIEKARQVLNKPMTLAEKTLYSHLYDQNDLKEYKRGGDYINLKIDRLAMQDATAQMALLQFMNAGKDRVDLPSTAHLDHLVRSENGVKEDLPQSKEANKEVYDFLKSVAQKYGIGLWDAGSGIIHQIVLENYAFPGGMMVGTDSHTPNAGGLGMFASGVGGADAVDVMVGLPWEVKFPKVLGVKLTGELSGWCSGKDVILELLGILGAKGGTGYVVEYFGEGAESLSCTGKATITNMGAELGATTSMFAYDQSMKEYLDATGREEVSKLADGIAESLRADGEVYANPEEHYDKVVEIDLSKLEPTLNGPFTPDKKNTVSGFKQAAAENDYPLELKVGLIGSCTNASYEDLKGVVALAKQAKEKGLKLKSDLFISPGSARVKDKMDKEGDTQLLESMGAVILANACGPCIGQWTRKDTKKGVKNSIITSFNRNFVARNDGNPETRGFVASPTTVFAYCLSGNLGHNFITEPIVNENGEKVMLEAPEKNQLPEGGFDEVLDGFIPPAKDGSSVEVVINPESERLEVLAPFEKPNLETDFKDLPLLIKAEGKCTTDHISQAGPWLRFRGHLTNISKNLLLTAVNKFSGETNNIKNQLTGEYGEVAEVTFDYKDKGQGWIIVGEENYGEGSSREHAAMEPRYLGARAVIVKSFARIHETNLKKQGVLPLTFVNPTDYNKIQEDDRFDLDIENLAPGVQLTLTAKHADGSSDEIKLDQTLNDQQIAWFKAGSALNMIAEANK